ncbi:MAG: hypothetical protein U0414_22350 [Polyangiaceae bacterium]
MVGWGDYRSLAAVASAAPPHWKGADVAVDDADVRGLDFQLDASDDPYLGFPELAAIGTTGGALEKLHATVKHEGAVVLMSIDSNHEGPGLLAITAPTRAAAERIDHALTSFRGAAANRTFTTPPGAAADEVQWGVLVRMSIAATASARQQIVGNTVRLEGTLEPAAEDRLAADRAAATKTERHAAWGNLLARALRAEAALPADLGALGRGANLEQHSHGSRTPCVRASTARPSWRSTKRLSARSRRSSSRSTARPRSTSSGKVPASCSPTKRASPTRSTRSWTRSARRALHLPSTAFSRP